MRVKLKFWRGQDSPGDVVDVLEHEAVVLFHHGAAEPVDAAEPEQAPVPAGAVVKGSAVLESTSGAADSAP